ncbi:APC family permease [Bacillus sp. JJ1764]|uniref:APC family permease n=1 Tax=Bacillus sp. JJ1764 TaxID=3122964 RepID=UPI002FFFF960
MDTNSVTLKRALTLKMVVFFGLTYMAPTTLLTTYGIAVSGTNGMIPTAYAIALFIMLFTAYSYSQMSKALPNSGAAYTYAQKSLNPHFGFLVGWTIIIDYLFSPMISALFNAIALNAMFPSIPMYVWIISFIVIVTTVNIFGIKLAANFNTILLIFQILSLVWFVTLAIKGLHAGKGAGTLFSTAPFYDSHITLSTLLSIVPILCFSFLGFDAVTTLSEETKDPMKTIPKGIYLVTFIGGLIFIVGAYFLQMVYPNFQSFKDPASAYIDIQIYVGGMIFNSIMNAIGITAGFASAVASGTSASRILYAMGRENVLPKKFFGYLSPKFQTPVFNILLIGVIALSAIFLNLNTAISLINFGALFAFFFVNLSVIAHYYFRKKQRSFKGTILYLVIPLIGAALIGLLMKNLDKHSLILGGTWLLVGFIYLLNLTKMFRQLPPELGLEEAQ